MSERTEEIIFDSSTRPPRPIEEIIQTFHYRNLVLQLLRRNILARYKRSFLGVAWTMLNPLGMMLVFTMAFSAAFNTPGYAAYVLCGITAWNFFAQTTNAAIVDLVWGGQLLHRIYIPRTSFALAGIGTGLVNAVLSLLPLGLVMIFSDIPLTWSVTFLPISLLIMACFSLGVGLLLSTFAVYFPDVAQMYQIFLQAWMYLTPVIYPETILPESIRFWVVRLNPMYALVNLFRLPIYDGRFPTWNEVLPITLISLAVLVVGWWYFSIKSDEFAYRI